MTKKLAIGIGAVLVIALMAGMVAVTTGRGVVSASTQTAPAPKPIVKTVTRVVTVKKHTKSPKGSGQVVTLVRMAPTTSVSSGSSSGSFESEHEREGDDRGEGDD
jgi:hypothetical protein